MAAGHPHAWPAAVEVRNLRFLNRAHVCSTICGSTAVLGRLFMADPLADHMLWLSQTLDKLLMRGGHGSGFCRVDL